MAKRALSSFFMRFLQLFFLSILFAVPTANVVSQKLSFRLGERIIVDLENGRFDMKLDKHSFAEGALENGRPNGKWVRFFANGTKAAKVHYRQGLKDGDWHFFHANGRPKAILKFENGKRVGHWKSFWPSGTAQMEILHGKNGNKEIKYFLEIDPKNSSLVEEEKYIYGKDSIVFHRKYFGRNRPYLIEKLKNGAPDSLWIRFHESGAVWEKLMYEDGKLITAVLMRDAVHNPLDVGYFANGSGLLKRYRPDGSLFSEVQYKEGEKHGRAWYYQNGKIAANGSHRNNLKVGTWKFYSESGNLKYEIDFYDAQEQWAYVTVYGNSGFEREESEYWKGLRHGLARTYSFLNELESEKHYSFGYLHGSYSEFLKAGNLRSSGAYAFGLKVGTWKYFNPSGRTTFEELFVRNPSIDTNSVQFFDMNDVQNVPLKSSVIWSKLKNPKDRDLLRFDMLVDEHPAYLFEPEVSYSQFAGGRSMALVYSEFLATVKKDLNSEVKGELVLRSLVDEFGFPVSSKIELGLGFGYDEAILQSLQLPLIYLPAELHGLPAVGKYRHEISID